ncbi:hypothetical protein [Mycobacterium parmense]|uniref:hypothetical protein n=1 Tax=Mycobacterium parmense TaxID=185642 RepID=UPI0035564DDB
MAGAGEIGVTVVQPGEIGFRSDDSEVVLGPGGHITKSRGQMHAMWNAGNQSGRIIEIITPGGFENYFRELGELLGEHADDPVGEVLHERIPHSRRALAAAEWTRLSERGAFAELHRRRGPAARRPGRRQRGDGRRTGRMGGPPPRGPRHTGLACRGSIDRGPAAPGDFVRLGESTARVRR